MSTPMTPRLTPRVTNRPDSLSLSQEREADTESHREKADRYRSPLNIRTPAVADEALRKRWHGMPPTDAKEYAARRSEPVAF